MLTRDQILARKTGAAVPHKLSDGSGEVMIRGLTRNEAMEIADADTTRRKDNVMISYGLVDPQLTVDDVDAWAGQDAVGVLVDLSEAIATISGMSEGAGKSRVSRARSKS